MKKSLVIISAISVAGLVCAGTITTPYVAGSMDGWAGPNSYTMTETSLGSDIWEATVSGLVANSRHEFKVTDGTWGTTYPGANSWLIADGAGDITITYDGNLYADGWSSTTDRIGLSYDPGTWTAVGSFQSQVGGADWDNANPATAMTDQGGGIYSLTITDLAEGDYDWKAVMSGTWDAISWDSRNVNAANWAFSTTATQNDVTFSVDAINGITKLEVIPEPATLGLIGLFGAGLLLVRRKFQL